MADSLGDRIKRYETTSRYYLTPRSCVILRADGRAFYTFTRGLQRPFDQRVVDAMLYAAYMAAADMGGFQIGYVQSDEASFLIHDYRRHETQPWFGNELQKLVSVTAALMTAYFNRGFLPPEDWADRPEPNTLIRYQRASLRGLATFDCRAFVVPRDDVANYFLWRARDWQRNSVEMYARSHFSHNELHKKRQPDMHEMLHGLGKNWATDLSDQLRNGTFFGRSTDDNGTRWWNRTDVRSNYAEVSAMVEPFVNVTTGQGDDADERNQQEFGVPLVKQGAD